MSQLKLTNFCKFCYDGEETVKESTEIIIEAKRSQSGDRKIIKPISLVILDLQMPRKNGMQVIEEIRAMINNLNQEDKNIEVQMPMFVFCTAFLTPTLKTNLKTNFQCEHAYEKPMRLETLKSLIE